MDKNTHTILGLSASHVVNDIYSPVLPAILPLLILQNGYSYFLAGLLVTIYQLTSSFAQPIVGWFYDKKNVTIPIPFAIFLSSFFMAFVGFVSGNYILTLLFGMGAALGHAFFHPGALGMVSKLAAGEHRGKLTSLFVIGGNLGFALGPLLVGLIIAGYGLDGLWLLFIPGFLMIVTLLKILPKDFNKTKKSDSAVGANTPTKYNAIILLVTASALRSWVIFACIAYLPTYLTGQGMDLMIANILTSAMLIAGVVGQYVGANISDKYGRREYTIAGMACALPPFILFCTTTGILSIIALIIFGYFIWTTFSVTVTMSHELAPQGTGMVSGLVLGFAIGAGGCGVAVTGYIADLTNVLTGISSLIIPIVASLILFAVVPYPWKTFGKKKSEKN